MMMLCALCAKMLAKADNSACTEAEAEAQTIMTRYNIQDAMLGVDSKEEVEEIRCWGQPFDASG